MLYFNSIINRKILVSQNDKALKTKAIFNSI